MLKLAVVICTATFFTLAMAGTLRTVALSELHRNIDEAVKNISQCADSVHQKVFDLGPLSIDFHSQLREEYEKNITDTIEKARSEVQGIFKKNVHPHSHTKNCQRFLTDLETTGQELAENSFTEILEDFAVLIDLIGGVPRLSSKKLIEVQGAELKSCDRSDCTKLEPTVNVKNVSSQFCSHTEELIDEYASMLNGSRSRTMLFSSPQYTTFISDARAIAEKTRSCVYSGLLDKTKSLYPWRLRTVSMVVSPVVQDGRNWNSRTIPKF